MIAKASEGEYTNAVKFTPSPPRASERQVNGTHYKNLAIQPSDYIVGNDLGWFEGNAVKYITRHRAKGGKQDILKAIHYLELLLEREYPNEDQS